ncbi:MAG TPA: YkgJ family cysteine cluster protein [Polyangiaceae bacterium]|nr:YkgJ family cysteine cluster protein [Polyangiaceae bacterium]
MPPRRILHRYQDPLDLVWLRAAERLGMRVERSGSVYASWDGKQTLTLAEPQDFDADDSLAQLIFHEICHALVAGPAGREKPDWGLSNTSDRDLIFEHACHRVQAALARPHGLRAFFAVTTEWREYWDALPEDPLAPSDDPALPSARRAFSAAQAEPWGPVLHEALESTARLAEIARAVAPSDSLWAETRARHVSGFLANVDPRLRCGECAWARLRGHKLACRQSERVGRDALRVEPNTAACEHWEPRLDEASCKNCGACCREGFDRVELRPRDTLRKKHPELVREDHWGVFVPRPDGRCLGLVGDGEAAPFRCTVYQDRPRSCREFEIGGAACLIARRRVGLSG